MTYLDRDDLVMPLRDVMIILGYVSDIEVCEFCYGSGEIRTHFKDWITTTGIVFHIESVMNCPKCDSKGYVKSLRISRV